MPRWRGGDLDRLLNAGHSALHEATARWFARRWQAWELAPEVSFAIYAERGVIDAVAWHAPTQSLLVIELKTELVDLNDLVGSFDRKRRLAPQAVRDRRWFPKWVGVWVIVANTRTARRRMADHTTFLRNAYAADRRQIRAWLANPVGSIAALSVETFGMGQARRMPRRVRRRAA